MASHIVIGKSDAINIVLVNPSIDDDVTDQIYNMLDDASSRLAESAGGHVPDQIVMSIIKNLYTSWESIMYTFSQTAHRVCLLDGTKVISAILIAHSPKRSVVIDSRNINAYYEDMMHMNLHQIFNFTTRYELRGKGFGGRLINWIRKNPRALCLDGAGLWTFVEPPDFHLYKKLGFHHDGAFDRYLTIESTDNSVFNEKYMSGAGLELPNDTNKRLKCFHMTSDWIPNDDAVESK